MVSPDEIKFKIDETVAKFRPKKYKIDDTAVKLQNNQLQPKGHKGMKAFFYFLCVVFLLAAALLIWTKEVNADISNDWDPYADAVTASSPSPGVLNPNNAVGVPDGATASMVGANVFLTLDKGAPDEGIQGLRIYVGQVIAQVNITVEFLDDAQNVITSETRQISVDPNPSTPTFAYNWTNYHKSYRYVRISSSMATGVSIDAIEALGYIGKTATQDTDGDGVPDRVDADPLVYNPPSGGGTTGNKTTSPSSSQKSGSSTSTTTTQGSSPSSGNSNTSGSNSNSGKSPLAIATSKKRHSVWDWLWIILLLIGAALSWLAAISVDPIGPPTETSNRWYKLRYSLHQKLLRS